MNNIEELTNAKEMLMALIKSRNELNERAVSLANEIYKKEIIDKITKHKNKGFVSTKK